MNHKLLIALFCSLWLGKTVTAQALPSALKGALQKMEADPSMKHAIVSLYVVDAATGAVIFDRNSQVGLAPASCQKLFTSVAALDVLGPSYQYRTSLGYRGKIVDGVLKGELYLVGSGDPTLGSWRYEEAKDKVLLRRWVAAIRKGGIRQFEGNIIVDDSRWESQVLPGGWIWEDIGNYYGAAAWGLNWHENQYDLRIKPGKAEGDPAQVLPPAEELEITDLAGLVRTGAPGSGDKTCIYLPPYGALGVVGGTVPLQKEEFVVSGSMPAPPRVAGILLGEALRMSDDHDKTSPAAETLNTHDKTFSTAEKSNAHEKTLATGDTMTADDNTSLVKNVKTSLSFLLAGQVMRHPEVMLDNYFSPRLDSINYWFLKKSINLYGEALIKTLAYEKTGTGSTEKGVAIVRDFWNSHGIEPSAIHIADGSGLSPQNRVTASALVSVLRYARTRGWYPAFYRALPEINGMRMKSGAIGGVRSYAGYQVAADGKEYVFSIIVNNYDGSAGEVVKKIFSVLDVLKGK